MTHRRLIIHVSPQRSLCAISPSGAPLSAATCSTESDHPCKQQAKNCQWCTCCTAVAEDFAIGRTTPTSPTLRSQACFWSCQRANPLLHQRCRSATGSIRRLHHARCDLDVESKFPVATGRANRAIIGIMAGSSRERSRCAIPTFSSLLEGLVLRSTCPRRGFSIKRLHTNPVTTIPSSALWKPHPS